MKKFLISISLVFLILSCGQNKKSESETVVARSFPRPVVPAMIQDVAEKQAYVTRNFWNGFLQGEGVTDSLHILGVHKDEVEQNLSVYVSLLNLLPVDQAQTHVAKFFKDLDERQTKEGESLFFLQMTELVVKYLYDPNSPLRSEDLYLPFVEGLVSSKHTDADKLPAYKFELEKCRLNPYGSVAPDFKYKDIKGRVGTLHKVKGEYTMLFFSNPGCESCLEIINIIQSRPYIPSLISSGKLSIVNIYIDYDIEAWKSYAGKYPSSWINAYDPEHLIQSDEVYFVRAIPSLYLLDKDKKVLFKDVPVERALAYLEETLKIQ